MTAIAHMNEDLLLLKRLESLRDQHRDLDDKIEVNGLDEFTKQRFKKMKLQLRDEIIKIEQIVYPDIIA
ncbi:MAG: YdcH family protein [Rickettsiales bacterium]